ncbi:MAG: hypothetical protein NTZ55_04605 [Candidatus Roizmanbacteria bacterium]|nr:hypothetical protein [Candidatus Roizmanbacteria bacterium]
MKNTLLIGGLVLIVGLLGVANVLLIKNSQKTEVPTPTIQAPSPTPFVEVPMLTDPSLATSEGKQQLIGGDKDVHGCLGPAGYSWCEVKQKCLRVWEEKCEASKISDADLIKQALFTKNNWASTLEVDLSVAQNDGVYAGGTVSEKQGGGGYFYAKKVASEWKIVADGNGMIMCETLKEYADFPKSMIPSCYNTITGETITR